MDEQAIGQTSLMLFLRRLDLWRTQIRAPAGPYQAVASAIARQAAYGIGFSRCIASEGGKLTCGIAEGTS